MCVCVNIGELTFEMVVYSEKGKEDKIKINKTSSLDKYTGINNTSSTVTRAFRLSPVKAVHATLLALSWESSLTSPFSLSATTLCAPFPPR